MGRGVRLFPAPFCAYASFINETQGPESEANARESSLEIGLEIFWALKKNKNGLNNCVQGQSTMRCCQKPVFYFSKSVSIVLEKKTLLLIWFITSVNIFLRSLWSQLLVSSLLQYSMSKWLDLPTKPTCFHPKLIERPAYREVHWQCWRVMVVLVWKVMLLYYY